MAREIVLNLLTFGGVIDIHLAHTGGHQHLERGKRHDVGTIERLPQNPAMGPERGWLLDSILDCLELGSAWCHGRALPGRVCGDAGDGMISPVIYSGDRVSARDKARPARP